MESHLEVPKTLEIQIKRNNGYGLRPSDFGAAEAGVLSVVDLSLETGSFFFSLSSFTITDFESPRAA